MFFNQSGNSCGNRTSHLQSLSITHILWTLLPAFWALLSVLLSAGCSSISIPEATPPVASSKTSVIPTEFGHTNTCMDILTFENDRLGRLDAYQRINDFKEDITYVESTGGKKIIFLCSGGPYYRYNWSRISSYSGLNDMRSYLKYESRESPTRTGELRIIAGDSTGLVSLKPIISQIRIEALSCDFSGTPYADKPITELKAYLINVNSSCPLVCPTPEKPIQILNHGKLSTDDIDNMMEPEILYSPITMRLDTSTIRPECCFLCMPNNGMEGRAGNPPTRLVLEGKIDGYTYYWPINIGTGQEKGTHIIERNYSYTYDIHIRRKGTTDPDIPISLETGDITFRIEPWIEKKEYGIEF